MNIKNLLKLTCAVFVVSTISTGEVSSSIFSGLANKAKSAMGSAKSQLTTSVSGLKNQAKQTLKSAKTAASDTIKSAQDQATASLSAVKEASSNAISSIIPVSEQTEKTEEDGLLLDKELTDADNILSELEEENSDTILPQNDSEELLLDEISPNDISVSKTQNEISDELSLDEDLTSDFPNEVIEKIDSLFPDTEKIASGKIIDLSNKNLNDKDIAYIAAVKIPSLSEKIEKITLKLSNNKFSNEGLKVLLDSLKTMPKLVSILDCSGNNIGDEGAMAIADSCQHLPLSHTIILSNCGISGTGILGVLSSILEINNSAYQYLDLSKNNIDPSYAPLIIEKLQTIKENSFEDGVNISETGIALSEGIDLPGNVILGK